MLSAETKVTERSRSAQVLPTSAGFGAISVSFRVFPWLNSGGVGVKCK